MKGSYNNAKVIDFAFIEQMKENLQKKSSDDYFWFFAAKRVIESVNVVQEGPSNSAYKILKKNLTEQKVLSLIVELFMQKRVSVQENCVFDYSGELFEVFRRHGSSITSVIGDCMLEKLKKHSQSSQPVLEDFLHDDVFAHETSVLGYATTLFNEVPGEHKKFFITIMYQQINRINALCQMLRQAIINDMLNDNQLIVEIHNSITRRGSEIATVLGSLRTSLLYVEFAQYIRAKDVSHIAKNADQKLDEQCRHDCCREHIL